MENSVFLSSEKSSLEWHSDKKSHFLNFSLYVAITTLSTLNIFNNSLQIIFNINVKSREFFDFTKIASNCHLRII